MWECPTERGVVSKYRIGTVLTNSTDEEWNPYLLTSKGWVEVEDHRLYPVSEAEIEEYLSSDEGWVIAYRGLAPEREKAETDA